MAPDAISGPDDVQAPRFLTDVILELGFATEEQVKEAIEAARLTNKTVEHVMVEHGDLTEEQLGRALAERNGIAYIDLSSYEVDHEALEQITPAIARRISAVPIGFADGNSIVVAIADPAGGVAAGEIGAMTRLRVRSVVAAKRDIDALIEKIPEKQTKQVPHERRGGSPQEQVPPPEQEAPSQAQVSQRRESPRAPAAPPLEGDMMEQVMQLADPGREVDLSPDLKLVHDEKADAASEAEMKELRGDLAKMLELEQDLRTTITQVGERLKRTGLVAGSERVAELEDQLKASEDARGEAERERDELRQRLAAIRDRLGGSATG